MFNNTPLQVVAPAELRERIRSIAERDGVSQAQVIRDILNAGIDARERLTDRDPRPHSRACGIQTHRHGPACSKDCPTCRD